MSCDQLRQRLTEGAALDEAALRHASECDACAELVAGDASLGSALASMAHPMAFGDVPTFSLDATLAGESGFAARIRALSTAARLGIAAGLSLAIVIGLGSLRARADVDVYPFGRMALAITAFAGGLGFALRRALRPLHLPPARHDALVFGALLLVPIAVAMLPQAHDAHALADAGSGPDLGSRALSCFVMGGTLALPLFIVLRWLDRSERASMGSWLVAALAVGLLANLVLQLHCPSTHPLHLLLGHASIGVVALALAATWRGVRA